MIIGSFTKQDSGYTGTLATLAVKAKVTISPVEKSGDKAPDYRVYIGNVEIGAGWSATSKSGSPYLSVKIDDPAFAVPVLARLVETDGSHVLVWTR